MSKIALVEDNADNRLLVQAMIGDTYDIEEYEDGVEALEGMRSSPPDLVLLDISLPQMDGTEVLAQMRSDPALKSVPAIALTAHAMAGDREKYLAAGFDEYITKPIIDADLVVQTIDRLLSGAVGSGPP